MNEPQRYDFSVVWRKVLLEPRESYYTLFTNPYTLKVLSLF